MSTPARSGLRSRLAVAATFALLLTPFAVRAKAQAAGYSIAGRVVNATTGAPVPRASVSALSEQDNRVVASTVSDAEGNFVIAGLPQGKYPLTASRRGYRTAYYDEHEESFNTAIVTGPDQDTSHLVFKLAPGAVIYGVITGDGGDPVENAQVMLFRRNPAAPAQPPVRAEGANTDDTGAYEFSDLAPGEYFVAVGAQPWYAMHAPQSTADSGASSLDVAYPITFFDSTTDSASASPIDIAAGERAEANISLHAVPAIRIKLTGLNLRNGSPVPVSGLRQTVFGADFPAQADVEGNGKGFEFVGLAPGRYQLETTNPSRTMEVDATSNMEVNPSFGAPSQPVDGVVRMAGGAEPPHLGFSLTRSDGGGNGLYSPIVNGKFHFDVPPGAWTLTPTALSESALAALIAVNGVPIPGNQITVRDQPLTLAVTLSRAQTQITGFARSGGKPAPGAMIVLVPRDPGAWPSLARRDQSDSDGSFSLGPVPPGRYTVVAIAGGWKLDWQDRAVIARYLRGGESVTINTQTAGVVPLPQPVQAALP